MGKFKTSIEVVGNHYVYVREGADGVRGGGVVGSFEELVEVLRCWLPIYPTFDASKHTSAPLPDHPLPDHPLPSPLAPEPLNNRPVDDPLVTPSRFQIGAPVNVAGTVVGVRFREGQVDYEVATGTTDALGEPDVALVRAYDVEPRVMQCVAGEWR